MNKRTYIQALVSIVLVVFLFIPSVIRLISATSDGNTRQVSFSKSAGGSAKADAQFLYEEKEKEEKGLDHSLDQLLNIHPVEEYFVFAEKWSKPYAPNIASYCCGNIPLFLAKRSILI